jgi:Ankyrin repeats (3 copies)
MTSKDNAQDEELLARYRRASDTDAAAPSESVRSAILAESRRVAEQLAKKQHPFDVSRPAANDARWKITAFGTVGAALLAALLIVPRYWESQRATQVSSVPAAAPAAKSASSNVTVPAAETASSDAAAPAPATVPPPKLEEVKPYAALSNAAPARQSPSESLQEIVVTQAERKASRATAEESRRYSAPAPSNPPSIAQNYAPAPAQPPVANSLASPIVPMPPSEPQVATSRAPLAASAPPAAAPAYSARGTQGGTLSMSADRAARPRSVPTPARLQSAAGLGDLTQAALLLDQGVAVDARDADGRTPLMLAVAQGRLEVVRLLLARGADPNAADKSGRTPLQQARAGNLRDVAALLERAGAH